MEPYIGARAAGGQRESPGQAQHFREVSALNVDRYGFPIPGGFDDEPEKGFDDQPNQRQPNSRRAVVAAVLLGLLGIGVILVANYGEEAKTYLAGMREAWAQRKEERLLRAFDKYVRNNPRDPRGYLQRANARSQLGHYENAIGDYSRVIDLDPDMIEAYLGRAVCRAQLRRYDRAVEDLTHVIQLRPDEATGYALRAGLRAQQRQYARAVEDCTRAIELDPDNPRRYVFRATLLAELDEYEQAAADYTRVIQLEPDDASAYNNRAYFRALAGVDLDEALDDVQKAIDMGGPNDAYLDTRGFLLYLLGRSEEALADVDEAIRLAESPDNDRGRETLGELYYHRALVHKKLGNRREAERDFQMAEELGFDRPARDPQPAPRIPTKDGLAV